MAKAGYIFLALIVSVLFVAEGRPLSTTTATTPTLKVQSPAGRYMDALGAVKDGPSPGAGHKYTNVQPLGGIKDSGPSPGTGNKVLTGTHN